MNLDWLLNFLQKLFIGDVLFIIAIIFILMIIVLKHLHEDEKDNDWYY